MLETLLKPKALLINSFILAVPPTVFLLVYFYDLFQHPEAIVFSLIGLLFQSLIIACPAILFLIALVSFKRMADKKQLLDRLKAIVLVELLFYVLPVLVFVLAST